MQTWFYNWKGEGMQAGKATLLWRNYSSSLSQSGEGLLPVYSSSWEMFSLTYLTITHWIGTGIIVGHFIRLE